MLYMVIERFKDGAGEAIYARAREHGRLLPDGVEYVASWVTLDFTGCYQLMRTDDRALLDAWTAKWADLVDFELIPVQTSEEAAHKMRERDAC